MEVEKEPIYTPYCVTGGDAGHKKKSLITGVYPPQEKSPVDYENEYYERGLSYWRDCSGKDPITQCLCILDKGHDGACTSNWNDARFYAVMD